METVSAGPLHERDLERHLSHLSTRDVLKHVLPLGVQALVRRAVYHHNCALPPERYRRALERWYRLSTGRICDLDAPRTLGEKIQWLKLYDSTPLKGRLADKYLVRPWVAQTIGEEFLVPLLGVWDRAEQIDFDALPPRFVLKATHGSGWNIIVRDRAVLDERALRRRLGAWLRCRTAMTGGFELHYEYCQPRIVAEQYLEDDSGGLRDYKIMTFDGAVQFIVAMQGRFVDMRMETYLPDWTPAPFHYSGRVHGPDPMGPPEGLKVMLDAAQRLGRGFACARVDFYEVDGRVYFGEMTFTDSNGRTHFTPSSYDLELGSRLVLPEPTLFEGVIPR